MGIPMMEELVSTVGAILKTLECPICLELLKTPVSAGCGHFFCRHCVSGILQSNYRAPCPLCKRSFTRRSVQIAAQRQSVISSARILAQTCSSLTGVNFIAVDSFVKESRKSFDEKTSVPLKKFRASNEKTENASSRKRKSIENEDVEKAAQKCVSKPEMEECSKPLTEGESPKKRACPNSEDEESGDDLPSLEDVFNMCNPLSKSAVVSVINETVAEKPLSIFPTAKMSKLRTYSGIHKKKNSLQLNSSTNVGSKSEGIKESYDDYFISNSKNAASEIEKGTSPKEPPGTAEMRNKINALKNKTNEVHPKKTTVDDNCVSKPVHVKCSNEKSEDKSKENEIIANPSVPSSVASPLIRRQSCTKKLKRSKKKRQTKLHKSVSKIMTLNQELATENNSSNNRDCCTLNEVALSFLQYENENEQDSAKKSIEDPFRSMGLTDTAISVDSVRSPLAAKNLSMVKSPGWSRVKEVKRDFKVKKFTSLQVEKNSPTISLKTTVISDQEPVPAIDKSDLSVDVIKDKTENKVNSAFENSPKDMSAIHSSVLINKVNPESEKGKSLVDDEQICQDRNVPEPINGSDIYQSDPYMEMDCGINNSTGGLSANSLTAKVEVAKSSFAITKFPTVSITSNSVFCTNYADTYDKISKQNVVKSKKIICEIPNNTSFNSDVTSKKNGNMVAKCIQDNCPEANNTFFSNPSEIKQNVFPLSSQISGYQSFHAQSVINEDDGFQYVEQSQQTSQMFNFDLQNPLYNKLNSIAEPRVFSNHACEVKTKVVKRTCLTLEEIQDCFLKSNQSNCTETLCSVPFLDGLFKLHIGVSDDTLNVSVLKVIEPTSEIDNAQSVLSNKYIQTSDSLLPLSSILPSSGAESESSQPYSAMNHFPYLNKVSGNEISNRDLPHSEEKSVQQNEPSFKETVVTIMPDETNDPVAEYSHNERTDCQSICEDEVNESNMDMSEIIHFAPESNVENDELFEKSLESHVCQTVSKSSLKEDATPTVEPSSVKTNCASMECDIPAKLCKDLSSAENKIMQLDSDGFSNSYKEESFKKLEKCVLGSKERGRKVSRLSLKKKSEVKRAKVLESSEESDLENSVDVQKSMEEKIDNKIASLPDKPVSPAKSMHPSQKSEDKENSLYHFVTGEPPSTLNSLLSEDAPETNTSEIILEIEDLADKIKSLEEKLKQCGHSDLQKSPRQQECSKSEVTDERSESEDSFDLFPQSVPPTPPGRV